VFLWRGSVFRAVPFLQMLGEPIPRQIGNFLERPGLLEQVRCTRNYLKSHLSPHLPFCLSVQLDNNIIVPADDEQSRSFYYWKCIRGEIGPAPARHYSSNTFGTFRSGDERSAAASAGTE
jgi:hypothetical protein